MSVSTLPFRATVRPEPVRWPRVGALSTSFSLHGVAAAAFLLAVSAPQVRIEPVRTPAPVLQVTVVEPPPAPPPAVAMTRPDIAPAVPTAIPALPTRAPTTVAPPLPVAAPPSPVATAATIAPPPATVVTASAGVDYATLSPPPYPPGALRRRAQGEVLVRVQVGIDGRPGLTELARSSGDRDLDRAALLAVRGWRFRPALASGAPVSAWVVVPVAFRLDSR